MMLTFISAMHNLNRKDLYKNYWLHVKGKNNALCVCDEM